MKKALLMTMAALVFCAVRPMTLFLPSTTSMPPHQIAILRTQVLGEDGHDLVTFVQPEQARVHEDADQLVAQGLANLAAVPSIVFGIFAYTLIVLPMRKFSALAGGFALPSAGDVRAPVPIPTRAGEPWTAAVVPAC